MNQANSITEQDMVTFRAIFERIADTIADHSKLRTELEELRKTIAAVGNAAELQQEVNCLRQELVTADSRTSEAIIDCTFAIDERDTAQRELSELRQRYEACQKELVHMERKASEAISEAEALRNINQQQDSEINAIKAELSHTRSDRDAEGYKVLELSEKLDKVTGELTWVQNDLERITTERDALARRLDTIKAALQG